MPRLIVRERRVPSYESEREAAGREDGKAYRDRMLAEIIARHQQRGWTARLWRALFQSPALSRFGALVLTTAGMAGAVLIMAQTRLEAAALAALALVMVRVLALWARPHDEQDVVQQVGAQRGLAVVAVRPDTQVPGGVRSHSLGGGERAAHVGVGACLSIYIRIRVLIDLYTFCYMKQNGA